MTQSDPKDLIVAALRQRIGEIVSSYETEIAVLRANYTKLKEEFDHISEVLAQKSDELGEGENSQPPITKFIPPDVRKKKDA